MEFKFSWILEGSLIYKVLHTCIHDIKVIGLDHKKINPCELSATEICIVLCRYSNNTSEPDQVTSSSLSLDTSHPSQCETLSKIHRSAKQFINQGLSAYKIKRSFEKKTMG